MYRVIVNNGYLYDEVEYNYLDFHFDNYEKMINFITIIFEHGDNYTVEISKETIKLKESDN